MDTSSTYRGANEKSVLNQPGLPDRAETVLGQPAADRTPVVPVLARARNRVVVTSTPLLAGTGTGVAVPNVAVILVTQALLQAEGMPIRLGAALAIKAKQRLPTKVTVKVVVAVLLLPTVVAVHATVALAEIVRGLSQTSAVLPIIGLVASHMVILQEEHLHLRRVFRHRQSSHCWKPGWRVQGKT